MKCVQFFILVLFVCYVCGGEESDLCSRLDDRIRQIDELLLLFRDPDDSIRAAAIYDLSRIAEQDGVIPCVGSDVVVSSVMERLRDPSADVSVHAAEALWNLSFENEEIQALVLHRDDFGSLFKTLLHHPVAELRLLSAAIISNIATVDASRIKAASVGIIPELTRLLQDGVDINKRIAVQTLSQLYNGETGRLMVASGVGPRLELLASTEADEELRKEADTLLQQLNMKAFMKVGEAAGQGLRSLLELLDDVDSDVRREAAQAISELAATASKTTDFVKLDAVSPLVSLLTDPNEGVRVAAGRGLWKLADRDFHKSQIVRAGGLDPLVRILRDSNPNPLLLVRALQTIASLTFSDATKDAVSETGVAPDLVRILNSGDEETRLPTVLGLWSLSMDERNQDDIVDHGGIIALLSVLVSKETHVRSAAARTLFILLGPQAERVDILLNSGGLPEIVSLLSDTSAEIRTTATVILWHLTNDDTLEEIVERGAVPVLVDIIGATADETQYSYAMAILEKLGLKDLYHVAAAKDVGLSALVELLPSYYEVSDNDLAVQKEILGAIAENEESDTPVPRQSHVCETVERLSSTDPVVRQLASKALWRLMKHDRNKETVVSCDGSSSLVALLYDTHEETTWSALQALSSISLEGKYRQRLHELDVYPRLVSLLRADCTFDHLYATIAVWAMSEDNAYLDSIADAGGLDVLLECLISARVQIREFSARALAAFSAEERFHGHLSTSAVFERVVPLILDQSLHTRRSALVILDNICTQATALQLEDYGTSLIVDTYLRETRQSRQKVDERTVSYAKSLRQKLTLRNKRIVANAMSVGFEDVVQLLRGENTNTMTQKLAVEAIRDLASSEENRTGIADAGGAEALVILLNSTSYGVRVNSLQALAVLAQSDDVSSYLCYLSVPHKTLALQALPISEIRIYASRLLLLLLRNGDCREEMVDNEDFTLLFPVLSDAHPFARQTAMEVIADLAVERNVAASLVENGLVSFLFDLFPPRILNNNRTRQLAWHTTRVLLYTDLIGIEFMRRGGAEALTLALNETDIDTLTSVTGCLRHLMMTRQYHPMFLEAHVLSPIISQLVALSHVPTCSPSNDEIVNMSKETLQSESDCDTDNTLFSLDEENMKCHGESRDKEIIDCGVGGTDDGKRVDVVWNLVSSLAKLSVDPSHRGIVSSAGAIAPLVSLLNHPGESVKSRAAEALSILAWNHEINQKKISEAGAIAPLVSLVVRDNTLENTDQKAQNDTRSTYLWPNDYGLISKNRDIGNGFGDMSRLGSREPGNSMSSIRLEPAGVEHALDALANLAWNNAANQDIIAKLDVIPAVCAFLNDSSAAVRKSAAKFVSALSWGNTLNQLSFLDCDVVPRILPLLLDNDEEVRKHAIGALYRIVENNPYGLSSLSKQNAVPTLLALISGLRGSHVFEDGVRDDDVYSRHTRGSRKSYQDILLALICIGELASIDDGASAIIHGDGLEILVNLLKDPDPNIQAYSLESLLRLTAADTDAVSSLDSLQSHFLLSYLRSVASTSEWGADPRLESLERLVRQMGR
eukprot:Rmarinus@m.4758